MPNNVRLSYRCIVYVTPHWGNWTNEKPISGEIRPRLLDAYREAQEIIKRYPDHHIGGRFVSYEDGTKEYTGEFMEHLDIVATILEEVE